MRPNNHGLPFEYFRWRMAKEFGWTLKYVDSLSIADLHEWLAVEDGMNKARTSLLNRSSR